MSDVNGQEEIVPASAVVPRKERKPAKESSKKGRKAAANRNTPEPRNRVTRNFPASTFEEAIGLAEAFQKFAAGQEKVGRLTLFDKLGKSADSGTSRQLVTNSSKYGLTKGSYKAEFLELTSDGALATGDDVALPLQLDARFRLAIKQIEPFDFLYERCKSNKMPSKELLLDALRETGIAKDSLSECVDTFVLNAKYLGLLRTLSGTERLITLEHAMEEASEGNALLAPLTTQGTSFGVKARQEKDQTDGTTDFKDVCFYISPIGGEDSQQRKHADFCMEFVVGPSLKEFGLKLVRADQIGKPGMIGKQVLEHILKSRLVIADLSFHNPNVFYELCLRHVSRLPTVQLTRVVDHIPFDIDQFRTVKLDTEDLYSFMPKLQTYTAEISSQVRQALRDPDSVNNPISMYYPKVRLVID